MTEKLKPAGIVEKGEVVLFRTDPVRGIWAVRVMGYPSLVWKDLDSNQANSLLEELQEFRK